MKFVFFGYDFSLNIVHRLLQDGHTLGGIFTFECDNIFSFNRNILALAKKLDVPVILSAPKSDHIESFLEKNCDLFLSAGYPYKIPPVDESKAYACNIHPSLLPKGRGLMPTPFIITAHPEAGGVSMHKMTQKIDGGDILYQEEIPVTERETVETYSNRVALRAPDIASKIIGDLSGFWKNAKPQNEKHATYFPPPDDAMRTLDWNADVKSIDRVGRAFGRFGSLAYIGDDLYVVAQFDVWQEKHSHAPGTLAHQNGREIVVAARDGYVCLKDFQKIQV